MPVSGQQIAAEVEKFKGYPYVWGATGPGSFDCSGLVVYVLGKLGIKGVPRTSEEQWGWAHHIPKSQLRPGDLVFANFGTEVSPGHVGVYLGDGQVLSAQSPASGVGVSSLASWGSNIVGYGRVPGTSADTSGGSSGGDGGGGGSIFNWPSDVVHAFATLDKTLGGLWGIVTALFNPSTYVRAAAGLAGMFLLAFGVWFLLKAAT